ncbi:MAG: DUF6352 family protein [Hyphomicrobiaceae bacterium]|nr:DUF6352 family protein [Hyphomicrobiaceae bacterium]
MNDFWKSAGMHLVEVNKEGWLALTPDFLRAYYTRPEVHPIETSCAEEVKLFEDLMADPFMEVPKERLKTLADQDAAYNYEVILGFRARLMDAGTVEGAYLKMMRADQADVPPVFIDQMVHLIVRNILKDCGDPIRLRAGEIFFRDQSVSTDDGMIMLADEEIVSMHAASGGLGGLGQLLVESDTPLRRVELDVMDEDNKNLYWERSDRFDMVVDFRFTQPALDAFARVIEAWVGHFLNLKVRVEPRQSVQDEQWTWHIGLDRDATQILNALYEGKELAEGDGERIVALFRMWVEDEAAVIDTVRGKPIYLGLAMSEDRIVKMKPQNLLTNMPLPQDA